MNSPALAECTTWWRHPAWPGRSPAAPRAALRPRQRARRPSERTRRPRQRILAPRPVLPKDSYQRLLGWALIMEAAPTPPAAAAAIRSPRKPRWPVTPDGAAPRRRRLIVASAASETTVHGGPARDGQGPGRARSADREAHRANSCGPLERVVHRVVRTRPLDAEPSVEPAGGDGQRDRAHRREIGDVAEQADTHGTGGERA